MEIIRHPFESHVLDRLFNYWQMLRHFMSLAVLKYQKEQIGSWVGMVTSVRGAKFYQEVVSTGGAGHADFTGRGLGLSGDSFIFCSKEVLSADGPGVLWERNQRRERNQKVCWAVSG